MSGFKARLAQTTFLVLLGATAAQAGGFQRGTADTDVLYDATPFSTRLGSPTSIRRAALTASTACRVTSATIPATT